jgi:hypothetical protein
MQIFDEVEDDQYDFHGYSMRRFAINIYLKSVLAFCRTITSELIFAGLVF